MIEFVLQASPHAQLSLFYLFNGLLSSISDNVFVGTVYINEVKSRWNRGPSFVAVRAAGGHNQYRHQPAIGRHAERSGRFLFLLTSALAPLIRLSYGRIGVDGAAVYHRSDPGRTGMRRVYLDAGCPVDAGAWLAG